MQTSTAEPQLTYRHFLRFPEDGQRHELIEGTHYVTPSPVLPHQRIVANLHFLIRQHLEEYGGGEVFLSPTDVVFSMFDIVVPDLFYVSDERRHILADRNVRGAPELVVEVLSPSTRRRDEGLKLRLYDRSEVREYWTIDPSREFVRIHRRVGRQLRVVKTLQRTGAAAIVSPLLPGLVIPLTRVFGPQGQ